MKLTFLLIPIGIFSTIISSLETELNDTTNSIQLKVATSKSNNVSLILVHNGNLRVVFDEVRLPKGKDGTLSRLHAYLTDERNSRNNIFYFNVGHSYMESFFHRALGFHILSQIMALLKPDAVSLGLKAFVGTPSELIDFIHKSNYPFLSCNTNDSKTFKPYEIYDLGNQVSLVVIGYLSPQLNEFNFYIKVTDPVQAISDTLKSITIEKRLVVIIGCSDEETEQKIASGVEGVHIIIGETSLLNKKYQYPIEYTHAYGKTLILRSCSVMKNIGLFRAVLDEGGNLVSYSGTLTTMANEKRTSQNLTNMLQLFKPVIDKYDGEVIAKSRVNFNSECRRSECNLGNLIADAFVEYKASQYQGPYWTDTAIALLNAGSIQEGVNIEVRNGEITRSDILNVLPQGDFLVSMTLTGEEIKQFVEAGMRNWEQDDADGSFLQVSGLRLICNKSLPVGHRVQYIKVRCAKCAVPSYLPIDAKTEYKIVTNEYLARGKDEKLSFKNAKDIVYEPITDVDAVLIYVQKFRIITTEVNDRMGTISFLKGVDFPPNYLMIIFLCAFCLFINAQYTRKI